MTEQRYRPIWEQGQGEQPTMLDGDRMTHTTIWPYGVLVTIKIERPVPNIPAMKRGTTFTAKTYGDWGWRRFMYTGSGRVMSDLGRESAARAVDPTTIRDVQAPPAMPEGDAS